MDPTIDSAACAQSLSVCNAALRNLSSSARRLQGDPCAASGGSHADALHIAAIFVVLVASAAGALIPLFSKHSTKYKISQYAIAVGKCTGTGVILSCALIHMLQPANASLTSPCVPTAFNTDYTSYAYLFALISALMMHYVDVSLGSWMETEAYVESAASVPLVGPARVEACGHSHGHVHHLEVTSHEETGSIAISTTTVPNGAHAALPSRDLTYGSISTKIGAAAVDASMPALARVPSIKMRALQQLASVYMIEFGITVHSVFIGLAAGVVGTDDLKALLVALSFHQFFEGVALVRERCSFTLACNRRRECSRQSLVLFSFFVYTYNSMYMP